METLSPIYTNSPLPSLPPPTASTSIPSNSMSLTILVTSYKQNQIIYSNVYWNAFLKLTMYVLHTDKASFSPMQYSRFSLDFYLIRGSVYMSSPVSQFIPPCHYPLGVHMFVLCVGVSISALLPIPLLTTKYTSFCCDCNVNDFQICPWNQFLKVSQDSKTVILTYQEKSEQPEGGLLWKTFVFVSLECFFLWHLGLPPRTLWRIFQSELVFSSYLTLEFCISHIFNLVRNPKIYENGRSQILILCGRLRRTYVKAFHLKKLTLLAMLSKY